MEDLKKAFDAVATGYDSRRELVIPEFQQFYSNAV
jgi:hypothetical protein